MRKSKYTDEQIAFARGLIHLPKDERGVFENA